MNEGQYPGGPQYPNQGGYPQQQGYSNPQQSQQGYWAQQGGQPQMQQPQGYWSQQGGQPQMQQPQGYWAKQGAGYAAPQHGYPQQQGYPNPQQPPQGYWAQPNGQPQKSSTGLIVGIVIGAIVLVLLVGLAITYPAFVRYRELAKEAANGGLTQYYFENHKWEGLNDSALIIPESGNKFTWYRDRSNTGGDYYSGSYKLYLGEDAVDYLVDESEVSAFVDEDYVESLEKPEYGATKENFVCLVLTNEKEVFYGQEKEYKKGEQVTTTLYGFYVNDKDGNKLTLVKYKNPYEFNLVPKDK